MKNLLNPRFLGVALLIISLMSYSGFADELRCECTDVTQGIHPKNIQSVIVKYPGPHCSHQEIIATLKTGQKVCLNGEAPMVKKMIEKRKN
ncbi:Ba158.3 [Baboon cytomegalovirus]|nr:Ba158.3 [Baboon cytomegalovirus]